MNPVTKDNMNYTSAALGVIGVVSLLTWITTGKKRFTGPIISDNFQEEERARRVSAEKSVESAEGGKIE